MRGGGGVKTCTCPVTRVVCPYLRRDTFTEQQKPQRWKGGGENQRKQKRRGKKSRVVSLRSRKLAISEGPNGRRRSKGPRCVGKSSGKVFAMYTATWLPRDYEARRVSGRRVNGLQTDMKKKKDGPREEVFKGGSESQLLVLEGVSNRETSEQKL